MTTELAPADVAGRLKAQFSDLRLEIGPNWLAFDASQVLAVCRFLYGHPDTDFIYLVGLTCVDFLDYFDIVYHVQSLRKNHIFTLKARVDHDEPTLPSVTSIWYGAYLQEMEVYDLMGVRFEGHPNLRRLFLWEGFAGWPLRKEFLQVGQGTFHPGLPHFPKEGGDRGLLNGPNWSAPPSPPGAPKREGEAG